MKIGIFSQVHQSASTWYRALMPFERLSKKMGFTYRLIGGKEETLDQTDLFQCDIGFFMRPHDAVHVQCISDMKRMGKKTWIDYDDDLFDVPFDHPSWEHFQLDRTKKAILDACFLADVISVTTNPIKSRFVTLGIDADKIQVIANAIDDTLFHDPTPPNEVANDFVCWRGSKTHDRDLRTIGPAATLLMRKNIRFIFMGHQPYAIEEFLVRGQYSTIHELTLFDYFDTLKKINAPFHVVPLKNDGLNRAKSNLAWLESTWIGGSLCLMPEFFETGQTYRNGDDLVDKITAKYKPQDRFDIVKENQDLIEDYFLLSFINQTREQILNELYP